MTKSALSKLNGFSNEDSSCQGQFIVDAECEYGHKDKGDEGKQRGGPDGTRSYDGPCLTS